MDTRISVRSAEILSRIIAGVALLVRSPRDAPLTADCHVFDCVWSSGSRAAPSGGSLSFWRPRALPGYGILGDCAVAGRGLHSFTLELNLSNSRTHS